MPKNCGGADQRVSIEGPYRRLLFGLDEREQLGELDVDVVDGEARLLGGLLAGLGSGDCYELVGPRDRKPIGRATVGRVERFHAALATELAIDTIDTIAPGCSARPLRYASPRAGVELCGFEDRPREREQVRARLQASGLLRALDSSAIETTSLPVVARLQLEPSRLQLWSGELRLGPACGDVEQLVDGCHRLARAALLARLATDAAGELDGWTMRWGRIESGTLGDPLPSTGAELRAGERVTVAVRTQQRLFVHMLMIHADGRIELLSRAQGGGVELEAGEEYRLGERSFGPTVGIELARPSVIRDASALPTTIMVVVSDRQVDLRSWEQHGVRRHAPSDPLVAGSNTRIFAQPGRSTADGRYRIEAIRFTVS